MKFRPCFGFSDSLFTLPFLDVIIKFNSSFLTGEAPNSERGQIYFKVLTALNVARLVHRHLASNLSTFLGYRPFNSPTESAKKKKKERN